MIHKEFTRACVNKIMEIETSEGFDVVVAIQELEKIRMEYVKDLKQQWIEEVRFNLIRSIEELK